MAQTSVVRFFHLETPLAVLVSLVVACGTEATPTPTPQLTPNPTPSSPPTPTLTTEPTPTLTPTQTPGPTREPTLTPSGATLPYPPSPVIEALTWHMDTHTRLAPGSDNWPMTWADDGHQYTAWGDGGGFGGTNSNGRVSLGVARVTGDFNNYYSGKNLNGGVNPEGDTQWPSNNPGGKSYGIISIGGVLYMWVTPGSEAGIYQEFRLWRSTNKGRNWSPANWSFGPPHFNATFINFGRDYAGARDGFVYTYTAEVQSTSGPIWDLVIQKPGRIHLLRAPVSNFFGSKSNWQWFTGMSGGTPTWGSQSDSVPVFVDPRGVGWNWSAIYNPGLQRYLVVTEHSANMSGGENNRISGQSRLGIFDASEPWGPWTTVTYEDNWLGFYDGDSGPFYWNFAPKWWQNDGKDFTLVFTGGPGLPWDSWNTIQGSFILASDAPPPPLPVPSNSIVTNLTVASGKPYQVVNDGLVSGTPPFIDRDFTFTSIPEGLAGATYIQTTNDDKARTDSAFLSFQVSQNAMVYVAYDHRASTLPPWLRDWDSAGQSIGTTDVTFNLYARSFTASSRVVLGGNLADGAAGANSHYFVVVVAGQDTPIPPPTEPPPPR